MSRARSGRFLLRIEDLDQARCTPEFEEQIFNDLAWLGIEWELPVWRQSERTSAYDDAIETLAGIGVLYPCSCSRGDIRAALAAPQEGDPKFGPDGIIYPGTCSTRDIQSRKPTDALRLNMKLALEILSGSLSFTETGDGQTRQIEISETELLHGVGDVVLARKGTQTAAYHLSVVVDDAAQNISDVVRGRDLFEATKIHVVLQRLLQLPTPIYNHHKLIRDDAGKRLAKRDDARAIATFRKSGQTPSDIKLMIGL